MTSTMILMVIQWLIQRRSDLKICKKGGLLRLAEMLAFNFSKIKRRIFYDTDNSFRKCG